MLFDLGLRCITEYDKGHNEDWFSKWGIIVFVPSIHMTRDL